MGASGQPGPGLATSRATEPRHLAVEVSRCGAGEARAGASRATSAGSTAPGHTAASTAEHCRAVST